MKHSEIQALDMENEVILCNSCCHVYPNCADEESNIIFGSAKGDDNICCCNKYEALSFRSPGDNGEL